MKILEIHRSMTFGEILLHDTALVQSSPPIFSLVKRCSTIGCPFQHHRFEWSIPCCCKNLRG